MTAKPINTSNAYPPRAQRFVIQLPILFRQAGQLGWSEGRSENISRSGILFRTDIPVDVGTRLELSFKLRGEMGGEDVGVVMCQAQIVRSVLPPAPNASPALAAKILAYHFLREQDESVA